MARRLLAAGLLLSGAAGLVYEVVWIGLAARLVGSTTAALGVVLAVFFGGMGAGNELFGRLARRTERPLAWLARAEVLLAGLALATLFAFGPAERAVAAAVNALGHAASWPVRIAAVALVLAPASLLLGATVPLACRAWVGEERGIVRDVGTLYALHTLGAAVGAALAGLVILPAAGYARTLAAGASASCAAAALVALSARGAPVQPPAEGSPPSTARPPAAVPPALAAAFFLVGFAALGAEVAWARFLALVTRTHAASWVVALTAVLVGILLGSLAAPLFDREGRHARTLGALQFGVAVLSMALAHAPRGLWESAGSELAVAFVLLLPLAVLSGATFPLAVRIATHDARQAGATAGRLLAVNTAGGIAGSLAIGLFALPAFGLEGALVVATAASLVGGAVAWTRLGESGTRLVPSGAVALWAAAAFLGPTRLPDDLIAPGEDVVAVLEGRESNLAVVRRADGLHLEIDRWWQGRDRKSHQILAAHVPMILHPAPREVLVVGAGVGQTPARFLLYPEVERLTVVDVEPGVFELVREHFDAGWLEDPRVRVRSEDGRFHLVLTQERYDVISLELGQLLRPGVASFYTSDFYALCRRKLADGGHVAQFVPLPFLDEETFGALVHTFLDAFPQATLWYNTTELLLVGRKDGPVRLAPDRLARLSDPGPVRDDLRWSHWGGDAQFLSDPEAFLALLLAGPRALADLPDPGYRLEDDRPRLGWASRRARAETADERWIVATLEALGPTDPSALLVAPLSAEAAARVRRLRDSNLADMEAAWCLRQFASSPGAAPGERKAWLDRAIEANPDNVEALRLRAGVAVLEGALAEAEGLYRRALRIHAGHAMSNAGLAVVLHRTGRAGDALVHYRAALREREDDAELHNNFGAALGELGRLEEAARQFERAVELAPDYAEAAGNLAKTRAALAR